MKWELHWFESRVRLSPNKEAVVEADTGRSWTFSEMNERVTMMASWLQKHGVCKGDRIALLAPNSVSYLDLLFSCMKIGAIFVPLNWRLASDEIHYILQDCTPKLLGYHSLFAEKLNELNLSHVQCFNVDKETYLDRTYSSIYEEEGVEEEETPLAILYTGGTTGKPKGVVLSHRSILWNAINTVVSWNLTEEDITLTYMPLFHTGGLNALSLPILMAGGKVVIANEFNASEAMHFLNKYQCTIVLFVPTMYHMIVSTDEFQKLSFPTVNVFLSGGAPCPLEIYEAFKRKGLSFKEGYGLTEAGPNNFYMERNKSYEKRGSVGKPMIFNTVKIMKEDEIEAKAHEVGELLIKGNHLFQSYWKNDQATEEVRSHDGWLRTGDLAKRDEDGYYYIVGRKKEMIITGGENVYPLEVEQWIAALPEIDEVAVVGVPHEKWGETVTAFVVLNENSSLTTEDLKLHCSKKLGNYKIPKEIIYLDELPKTHVGKVDKKELRNRAILSKS